MITLTVLEAEKLRLYKKRIGAMTAAEALELAMESEQFMRDCGPFDAAFEHFARSCREMTNYAELLEKEEQSAALAVANT
jgi:hypothetical protein